MTPDESAFERDGEGRDPRVPGGTAESADAADSAKVNVDQDFDGERTETAEDVVEAADELFDIDRVLVERDEYLDSLRRVQAEFDNYRKRMARQQTELLERASESLIERLLPVLDALDLAIAHSGPTDAGTNDGGGALPQIAALLRDTLTREGLERIGEAGVDFDPTEHDAVAHLSADSDGDAADGDATVPRAHRVVVSEVLRAGYRLKGRVLRPAMVQVKG
jgi:molecular chaperone GrpE